MECLSAAYEVLSEKMRQRHEPPTQTGTFCTHDVCHGVGYRSRQDKKIYKLPSTAGVPNYPTGVNTNEHHNRNSQSREQGNQPGRPNYYNNMRYQQIQEDLEGVIYKNIAYSRTCPSANKSRLGHLYWQNRCCVLRSVWTASSPNPPAGRSIPLSRADLSGKKLPCPCATIDTDGKQ